MKDLIYIVAGVITIGLVVALLMHMWRDCLNDHSIFTCMRMLR
jgi:hypothetical protein